MIAKAKKKTREEKKNRGLVSKIQDGSSWAQKSIKEKRKQEEIERNNLKAENNNNKRCREGEERLESHKRRKKSVTNRAKPSGKRRLGGDAFNAD